MNIHGYKLKLKEVSKELKEGKDELGFTKYNELKNRERRLRFNIKRSKEDRAKKKGK